MQQECKVDRLINILFSKWTGRIIWIIRQNGVVRFGGLRKQLAPISAKILTARLKALVDEEIIWREQEEAVPPVVKYGLTKRGEEFAEIIARLIEKAEKA